MKNKIINVALIGKTNAGKSTFINSIVGEKISIENRNKNTTLEAIIGILNIKKTQIVFYDTPGTNFLKTTNIAQKKQKTELWEAIYQVDLILFIIDTFKFSYSNVAIDIKKINEINKPIIVVFNKIDLIKKEIILSYIDALNKTKLIKDFFNISAKYNKGIDLIINYLVKKSKYGNWKYKSDQVSNKSDIFISEECTRNALLKFLHEEIPYNISVKNKLFKPLNKKNIKIKQFIEIKNLRYKSIIIGKKGETIKKIREWSQKEIESIFNSKIHLYLEVIHVNAK